MVQTHQDLGPSMGSCYSWTDVVLKLVLIVYLMLLKVFSQAIHILFILAGAHMTYAGLQIFSSRLVGRSDPWSKKWWVIFWKDVPKHIKLATVDIWVVYFTYTLTQTLEWIMYIDCRLYSKTCLKWPLEKEDQLSLNAGQKYCRMLKGEPSAILSTFIKLPFFYQDLCFVFFEWLLKTCFTVLTAYMNFLFCGVCRLAVRWIFFIKMRFFHN